jgi:hypothetical membrane protein
MNLKILRLSGFIGMLAPVFGLMLIGTSIWMSPWFTWTGNSLSDIGGSEGLESVVFNGGLAMTAALMMMFSAGLFEMTKGDTIGQIGAGVSFLATVLLLAIGIVNITIQPWHNYIAVAFFVSFPLSAILVGYFCYQKAMKFYTLLGWGTAVLAIMIWFLPWSSLAIPEGLSVSYLAVWQILLSYWMFTKTEDKLEK